MPKTTSLELELHCCFFVFFVEDQGLAQKKYGPVEDLAQSGPGLYITRSRSTRYNHGKPFPSSPTEARDQPSGPDYNTVWQGQPGTR